MNFNEYADSELLTLDLARILARDLRNHLKHNERVTFAVPGGRTPVDVFEELSAVHIAWERVDVILTDERWVPEDHPRSNAGLIRRHLLKEAAAVARFHPYWREGLEPEAAVGDLALEISPLLPIHVLLLGMGEDLHVASLFPDAPEIGAALAPDAPVLMVMRPPSQPEPRITLTAPVLRGAYNIHLAITGEAKRAALGLAQEAGDPLRAPVLAVLDEAEVYWAP